MSKLLSIIVPIYNEEKIVADSLPQIFNLKINKEIIVVNDGSTDNTLDILNNLKNNYNFELINQITNQGKGAAVKRGLEKIKGDYFIICDADSEYDPQDITKLFQEIVNQNDDNLVIYGSRFLNQTKITFHYLVNHFLTSLTNLFFDGHLTDMETCFKLIPKKSLKKINLTGRRFEIEPEITAQLLKNNYKIIEKPINYRRRGYREGKKITPLDGVLAIIMLIREKLFNR